MDEELKKIRKNLDFYKKEYDGAMIMFRVSGFYEMYDKDAIKASEILRICRINRMSYNMVGFPKNKLDEYLHKFIRNGYKVVIADMIDIEETAQHCKFMKIKPQNLTLRVIIMIINQLKTQKI